ncbi:hypothetical protein Tco_0145494 [Tanacetum coccineum]
MLALSLHSVEALFVESVVHRVLAEVASSTHWSELVQETTERIIQIKQRIQTARDRQKSYADLKRKPMEFQVGDKVMLKVSPWKGVVRFGKRGKLNPRYVRPFKVLKKVGAIAYKLELPQELSSILRLQVDDKLHFVEEPVEIMDHEVKQLRRSRVPIVKVRWNSRRGPEFTWEREDQFRKKYPHLFTKTAPSRSLCARDFDELTAMASEHSCSRPTLHEMTPAIIGLGFVPNPPPSTPLVPPSRTDWDILFQSLFDELLTPSPSVDHPAPEVIAPIAEVVTLEPAASTGSPSSTTIDQDAPSPSNS